MNSFTVALCASLAITAVLAYPQGHGYQGGEGAEGGDYHHVPAYEFKYGVLDPHTKDHKSQEEHREHDDVKGSYTIHDPDGTKRIVEYTSGKHTGFQAVVRREGHAQHPAHYGKHAPAHGQDAGVGGTSYVGITHWGHGSGK